MVRIELVTDIAAPIKRCFDLSRSVDLHVLSTDWTGEKAVAGVTTGLLGANQQVTWRGRHFGFNLRHTSIISAFDRPSHFQDRMLRGAFKSFCHDHHFADVGSSTRMTDVLEFEAPLGFLGRIVEPILARHLRSLLERRNRLIKSVGESEQWRQFLR
jgi:ligand-binding SRPBCC domain-containing protein